MTVSVPTRDQDCCLDSLDRAIRIFGRSLGYGAVVGAVVGTAAGLPFAVFGAFFGGPIGCVYGAVLGFLNAPALIFAAFRWSTKRASRIAAAITSGSAGLVTVIIINSQPQPAAVVIVTILWAGIG